MTWIMWVVAFLVIADNDWEKINDCELLQIYNFFYSEVFIEYPELLCEPLYI